MQVLYKNGQNSSTLRLNLEILSGSIVGRVVPITRVCSDSCEDVVSGTV